MIVRNGTLSRGERLQIMLSPDELTALDDFRFEHRMPTRAAAVRELLRLGLSSRGLSSAPLGTKSKEFGVLKKLAAMKRGNSHAEQGKRISA